MAFYMYLRPHEYKICFVATAINIKKKYYKDIDNDTFLRYCTKSQSNRPVGLTRQSKGYAASNNSGWALNIEHVTRSENSLHILLGHLL